MDGPSLDAVYIGGAAADVSDRAPLEYASVTPPGLAESGCARAAMPFLPSLIRDPMQIIELHLSARDITSLARADTTWRASLAQHEVIVALQAMGRVEQMEDASAVDLNSAYAAGSDQIQRVLKLLTVIRSPHRLALVREFASRMPRSPGAYTSPVIAVWRDLLDDPTLYAATVRNDADTIQRDRIATELHAFVPFKYAASWQWTVVRMSMRALPDIPLRHQPDIMTVLLGRVAPETLDPHLRRLIACFDEWDVRPSVRVLSSLAAMMLFDVSRDQVCATLCKKFGLPLDVTRAQLEPLIARDFVRHFWAKAQPLRQVLYRWDPTPDTLGVAVHRRLLIESATRMRGCASAASDKGSGLAVEGKTIGAFERLYGVPAHAAARTEIDAAMLSFWDVYRSLTGSAGFGVSRGWQDCRTEIDRLPWTLQPTLMGRLVAEAHYLQWCGNTYGSIVADVIAWEARIVRQCLDHGYPVLAQRALMVRFNIHMCQRERWSTSDLSALLDRVFRIVQDHTPVATWGEWLESLCAVSAYGSNDRGHNSGWHHEAPFKDCLTRFVSDSAARVFAPSVLFKLALIRESVHFWESVPLDEDPSLTKLDGFCKRMDLLDGDRVALRKRLSGWRAETGSICEAGNVMPLGF